MGSASSHVAAGRDAAGSRVRAAELGTAPEVRPVNGVGPKRGYAPAPSSASVVRRHSVACSAAASLDGSADETPANARMCERCTGGARGGSRRASDASTTHPAPPTCISCTVCSPPHAADRVVDLSSVTSVLDAAYRRNTSEVGYDTLGHTCLTDKDHALAVRSNCSLLYGEVLPPGVVRMLDHAHLRAHAARRMFDLGMGVGKLCMQAWLMYSNLVEVTGVELAPSRYAAAEAAAVRLAAASAKRFRVHRWVKGVEISVCEEAGPHINSDDLASDVLSVLHTHCATCGDKSRCRVLTMRCGNLFDVTPAELRRADIIVMETDLPDSSHARLCRFIAMCKRRARLLTYLNLRRIWPAPGHAAYVPCPLRQVASNMSLTDRFSTSWAFQTGHHFFLWKCQGELLPAQLLHPVPEYALEYDHPMSAGEYEEADIASVPSQRMLSRDDALACDLLIPTLTTSAAVSHMLELASGATLVDVADGDPSQPAGVVMSHVVQDDDGELVVEERVESMLPVPHPPHVSNVCTVEHTEPSSPPAAASAADKSSGSGGSRRLLIRVPIGADWAVDCAEGDLITDDRGYIVGIRLRGSETLLAATSDAATTAATVSLSAAMQQRDGPRSRALRHPAAADSFECATSVRKSAGPGPRTTRGGTAPFSIGMYANRMERPAAHPKAGWRKLRSDLRRALGIPKRAKPSQ